MAGWQRRGEALRALTAAVAAARAVGYKKDSPQMAALTRAEDRYREVKAEGDGVSWQVSPQDSRTDGSVLPRRSREAQPVL